ncbi:hypothetical protein M9H77_31570 [Catharanthus roseus]|uniref:Uncharacterized protein n=1 Tax=Catharanthus roseus TaxID=4058 RepID=A0ACC0A4P7_CATRO|nr:hypothetical protein M9H77_31570 [Catharanthus roseus]
MASKGKGNENGTGRRVDERGNGLRRRNVDAGEGYSRGMGVKGMLGTDDLSIDDVMKMTFDLVKDADTFYMMYTETRVKCGACFRIKYDVKQGKYYSLGKYDRPELTWTVELINNSGLMECSCMVMEHMQSILSPCILKRWTHLDGDRRNICGKISETVSEMARYGMLSGLCGILSYHASKNTKQTSYLKGLIEIEIEQPTRDRRLHVRDKEAMKKYLV